MSRETLCARQSETMLDRLEEAKGGECFKNVSLADFQDGELCLFCELCRATFITVFHCSACNNAVPYCLDNDDERDIYVRVKLSIRRRTALSEQGQ